MTNVGGVSVGIQGDDTSFRQAIDRSVANLGKLTAAARENEAAAQRYGATVLRVTSRVDRLRAEQMELATALSQSGSLLDGDRTKMAALRAELERVTSSLNGTSVAAGRLERAKAKMSTTATTFNAKASQTVDLATRMQPRFEKAATAISGFGSAFGGMGGQMGAVVGLGSNLLSIFGMGAPLLAGIAALAGGVGLVASKFVDMREEAKKAAEAAEQSAMKVDEMVDAKLRSLNQQLAAGGRSVSPEIAALSDRVAEMELDRFQALSNIDLLNDARSGDVAARRAARDAKLLGGSFASIEEIDKVIQAEATRAAILEGNIALSRLEAQDIVDKQLKVDAMVEAEKARLKHVADLRKEYEKLDATLTATPLDAYGQNWAEVSKVILDAAEASIQLRTESQGGKGAIDAYGQSWANVAAIVSPIVDDIERVRQETDMIFGGAGAPPMPMTREVDARLTERDGAFGQAFIRAASSSSFKGAMMSAFSSAAGPVAGIISQGFEQAQAGFQQMVAVTFSAAASNVDTLLSGSGRARGAVDALGAGGQAFGGIAGGAGVALLNPAMAPALPFTFPGLIAAAGAGAVVGGGVTATQMVTMTDGFEKSSLAFERAMQPAIVVLEPFGRDLAMLAPNIGRMGEATARVTAVLAETGGLETLHTASTLATSGVVLLGMGALAGAQGLQTLNLGFALVSLKLAEFIDFITVDLTGKTGDVVDERREAFNEAMAMGADYSGQQAVLGGILGQALNSTLEGDLEQGRRWVGAMDSNTDAVRELTRSFTNIPGGYRTAGAIYDSAGSTGSSSSGGSVPSAPAAAAILINHAVFGSLNTHEQMRREAMRKSGNVYAGGPRRGRSN